MLAAMKYGRVSARINGLAVVRRLGLTPEGRAAWIQSWGCVGSICEGTAAAYTGLVSAIRCRVLGFARSFGLGPWIADVRGG
jgi:hypothetical protein